MKNSKKIYLDYAATTPVDSAIFRAMEPYFSDRFGNAGSLHSFGQAAIAALDAARETVAAGIGANFRDIIFTGSATEANNLVLRGVLDAWKIKNPERRSPRIIISSIEHESVLETARNLENNGADVVYLPVDKAGIVDVKKLKASLNKDTVLVSVMYANNEIGTIQPIVQIAKIIDDFKKIHLPSAGGHPPFFHTDAAQALQFLDCDIRALGADFLTISSHKIYGPKGAGALCVAASHWPLADSQKKSNNKSIDHKAKNTLTPSGYWLNPIVTGGGQEFGLRSGTENIPAIVGFSEAVKLLANLRKLASKRIEELQRELWRGIKKTCPKAEINGALSAKSPITDRALPNILNVYFPKQNAQDLLTKFDLAGLAASSGSACRARASTTSYVIEALGHSKERARSSIRFSIGRPTTKNEIARALTVIKKTILSAE